MPDEVKDSSLCCAEGCTKKRRASGGLKCATHYRRDLIEKHRQAGRFCKVAGCCGVEESSGLCLKHRSKEERKRDLLADPEGRRKKDARKARVYRARMSDEERKAFNEAAAAVNLARYHSYSDEEKNSYRARVRFNATGWSIEAEDAAFETQGGRCAICPRELVRVDRRLGMHCDHYEKNQDGVRVSPKRHCRDESGRRTIKFPRALLCPACNSGLGHYESDNGQRAAGLRIQQYEDYILKYGG